MKRTLVSIFLSMTILATPLYAKGLTTVKGEGGVTVKVSLLNDPPIVDKNKIKVEFADAGGKAITDAKVKVSYSMTPMKGMAPMNHKAKAKLEGDSYIATMNIGMKGKWDVKIRVKRKNASSMNIKASFQVK